MRLRCGLIGRLDVGCFVTVSPALHRGLGDLGGNGYKDSGLRIRLRFQHARRSEEVGG